jgi:hypothetical protein
LGLLAGGLLIGCSQSQEQPSETGARESAQAYYEALIQQDWPMAYAALDSQSQKRCSAQQFRRLAQSYRHGLGFDPDAVQVWACDERGAEATAHVVLTGRAGAKGHRFKDAALCTRGDGGWRVVLSLNFGQSKRR